jgi:uncharacterized membrane protein YhaH (DUF805 family)
MKKLFKENSMYLIVLTIAEIILSIVSTLAFVYSDSLSYSDSVVYQGIGLDLLLQNLYSSTFWALILVVMSLIAILSVATLVFKKLDYLFIGICGWIYLFILSINLTKPIGDILSTCAMFIPIIIINIICYRKEKEKLETKNKKKVSK